MQTAKSPSLYAMPLLREPLVQFLLIGAVLFAISLIAGTGADRARVIDLPPGLHDQYAAALAARLGRPAPEADVQSRVNEWIRNEVLYREALALGLDRGDETLRARLIEKMDVLIQQQSKPVDPDDKVLSEWFAAHRALFDQPAEIDFIAVLFSGANAEAQARQAVAQIDAGTEPPELRLRARVYLHRDPGRIDAVFGAGFIDALRAAKPEKWAVAHGKDGWFVVRVDALRDARPARFEDVRGEALVAWRAEQTRILARRVEGALSGHYIVRGGGPGTSE